MLCLYQGTTSFVSAFQASMVVQPERINICSKLRREEPKADLWSSWFPDLALPLGPVHALGAHEDEEPVPKQLMVSRNLNRVRQSNFRPPIGSLSK
jgi:hypothetical protein